MIRLVFFGFFGISCSSCSLFAGSSAVEYIAAMLLLQKTNKECVSCRQMEMVKILVEKMM